MQRNIFILRFLIVLACIPIISFLMGARVEAQPTVQVEVSAPPPPAEEYIPEGDPTPPPALTVQNPELVVVPSGEAQVYMVPNMSGVYFYGGSWYRYHHGVWFRAGVYNEPWVFVEPPMVPSFVVGISPFYPFYLPRGYHRIHYGEFHSHWRTWDREKHWHNQPWYKNERRAEVRHAREQQAHARMEKERHVRNERIKERERHPQRVEHKGPQKTGEVKRQHPAPVGAQKTGEVKRQQPAKVGPQKTGEVKRQQPAKVGPQKTGEVKRQQPAKVGPQRTGQVNKTPSKQNKQGQKQKDNQQNLK